MANRETKLYGAIIEALARAGLAWMTRVHSGKTKVRGGYMQLAPTGTPDLLGHAADGRAVALEVKVPGEDGTPEQLAYLAAATGRGVITGVVTSPAEAVDVLRRALKR